MPAIGQRVGEYILEAQLGTGAFGEVWRAHHHVWMDQLVAIKIPTDPQYLRSFQGEGAVIHGLVHPNIVRAIGFDPYAQVPYLTMEYVPGTSLRPLIQQRKLTIADTVAVMRQVLAGLQYAHERKVIHRDIKPENILVHERAFKDGFAVDGVVKVADFGLGKIAAAAAESIAFSASLKTPAAREIAGTLDYMSPEQRAGADPDARVDLYACGVMFYEMLTGERPAGTDVPSDLNKNVPANLDEAFRRSYARLDKRYTSASEFLAALALPVRPAVVPHVSPPPPGFSASFPGASACPQCHKNVDPNDQFCMHCGVQLVEQVRRCQRCGAFPDRSDRFCIFCGEVLQTQPALA